MDKIEIESKKIAYEIFREIINRIDSMNLLYQMDKLKMLYGIIKFLEEEAHVISEMM